MSLHLTFHHEAYAILPCSHCGGEADFVDRRRDEDADWQWIEIRCRECWYEVQTKCGWPREGYEQAVVDAWNEANRQVPFPAYRVVRDKDGDAEAIALGTLWVLDLNPGTRINKANVENMVEMLNKVKEQQ
jgi:hypothetical protein